MDRREFIGTLAGGLLAAPFVTEAQQSKKIPRVGVLWPNPPATFEPFRQGLKDRGYAEGQNATRTIPIVFVSIGDPLASGLVASLARPGGTLTGTTRMLSEVSAKHLQLLKDAVPLLSQVAVL